MIEHIARYPRLRDRAIFVGNPDDIVPDRFGRDLPPIRDHIGRPVDYRPVESDGAERAARAIAALL